MLQSKLYGYNNNSGLIYRNFNGLAQYELSSPMLPISSNVYPQYINKRNEDVLLDTLNDDGTDLVNKQGNSEIKTIPNIDLSNGGFINKGKLEQQTDIKGYNKLVITKEAKALARRNIRKLPTEKSKVTKDVDKILNKFDSFLSRMEGSKFKKATAKPISRRSKKSKKESAYNSFAKDYEEKNNDPVPSFDMI